MMGAVHGLNARVAHGERSVNHQPRPPHACSTAHGATPRRKAEVAAPGCPGWHTPSTRAQQAVCTLGSRRRNTASRTVVGPWLAVPTTALHHPRAPLAAAADEWRRRRLHATGGARRRSGRSASDPAVLSRRTYAARVDAVARRPQGPTSASGRPLNAHVRRRAGRSGADTIRARTDTDVRSEQVARRDGRPAGDTAPRSPSRSKSSGRAHDAIDGGADRAAARATRAPLSRGPTERRRAAVVGRPTRNLLRASFAFYVRQSLRR